MYGAGKRYNDYRSGFYCTQNLDLVKEWAVSENQEETKKTGRYLYVANIGRGDEGG